MCQSRFSRWWGSSVKRPRRKLTRSLSLQRRSVLNNDRLETLWLISFSKYISLLCLLKEKITHMTDFVLICWGFATDPKNLGLRTFVIFAVVSNSVLSFNIRCTFKFFIFNLNPEMKWRNWEDSNSFEWIFASF